MKFDPRIEDWREQFPGYISPPGANYGAFMIPGPCGENLVVIAADASDPVTKGWEHVSVSTRRRCPNWIEMYFIKKLFWAPDDCVVQFHPPESEYVNIHPFTLHLWRSTVTEFPMPPLMCV